MARYDVDIYANDRTGRALSNIERQLNSINSRAKAAVGAVAGLATGAIARGIARQYSAYERYNTVLRTYLGSQERANSELERLQKLADSLPQDLDDVTQAFTIFTRTGLDTSSKALTAFSNIATANGKSLTQLGEAVADALTGEFERLKEFGIKVSKENDKFVADIGNGQTIIANSTAELVNQLKALGEEGGKFGGAAAANADTLNQSYSNLQGAIYRTSITLGNALKPALKGVVDDMTDLINKNQEMVQKFGIGVGEAITALVASVNAIGGVVQAFGGFANTIASLGLAALIGRFSKSLFTAAAAGGGLINVFSKVAGLFKNVGLALIRMVGLSNPVTAALTLISLAAIKVANVFGYDVIDGIKGVVGWFASLRTRTFELNGAVATIPEYFRASFQLIGKFAQGVVEYLKNTFWGNFFDPIESAASTFADWFGWAFETIGEYARKAVNFLANAFIAAGETIINVAKNLPEYFGAAFDAIVTVASDAVSAIGKKFTNLWEAIKLGASGDFAGAFAKLGEDAGYSFTESFSSAFSNLPSLTSGVDYAAIFSTDRVGQAMGALREAGSALGLTITSYVQPAMDALTGQIQINQAEAARLADQLRMLADEDLAMSQEVLVLADALDTVADSAGTADSTIAGLGNTMSDVQKEAKTVSGIIKETWADMSEGMSRGIAESIVAGKGAFNSFKDYLKNFANEVLTRIIDRMLIQPMMNQMSNMFMGTNFQVPTIAQQFGGLGMGGGGGGLLGGLFGGGGGGLFSGLFGGIGNFFSGLWGGISNFFGGLFGGFFANGGYLPAGKVGIAGEAGPELISGPANITPLNNDAGGALTVNFNIQAIDSQSGTEFILQHKREIEGVIQNAYNRRGKEGIY